MTFNKHSLYVTTFLVVLIGATGTVHTARKTNSYSQQRQQIIALQNEIAELEKKTGIYDSKQQIKTKKYSRKSPKTTADEIAELAAQRDVLKEKTASTKTEEVEESGEGEEKLLSTGSSSKKVRVEDVPVEEE